MQIISDIEFTEKDAQLIMSEAEKMVNGTGEVIETIKVTDKGDNNYNFEVFTSGGAKFERIRRITGYLVGTVDRWNDAKKAELKDREKHA